MSSNHHLISLTGVSMAPYLRQGDHVLYQTNHFNQICFGELALLRSKNNELIVHRSIGSNLFKGDRAKINDLEIEYLGHVIARVYDKKIVSLNRALLKPLRVLLALLSRFNRHFGLSGRIIAGAIATVGFSLRFFENLQGKRL